MRKRKRKKRKSPQTVIPIQPQETKSNFLSRLPGTWPILVVFILAGCYILFQPLKKLDDARFWTATPAMVISSSIDNTRRNEYCIVIEYQYELNRVRYISKRYEFGYRSYNNPDIPEKIIADYPAGKKITCYVDPKNLQEAVISRNLSMNYWQRFIFPLVITIVPIIFLFHPPPFRQKP